MAVSIAKMVANNKGSFFLTKSSPPINAPILKSLKVIVPAAMTLLAFVSPNQDLLEMV
jgi:hypothetical protein